MAAQQLDELFVSLAVKGFQDAMGMIRAFKDHVREAHAEMAELMAAAGRGSRGTSFVPPRPLQTATRLPVARRIPTATRVAIPVATPEPFRPIARARTLPVGKPIPPPAPGPWQQFTGLLVAAKNKAVELKNALAGVGTVARIALAGATASVLGFVRAGLSDTVEGNYLALQWKELSREIASVFLPIIRQVSAALQTIVTKFRELDGNGQARVRNMALLAGGAGVLAGLVPKIVGGMGQMVEAGVKLAMSFGATAASAGLVGVIIAAVVAYLVAVAAAFAVAYTHSERLRASVGTLVVKLEDIWKRVEPAVMTVVNALGHMFADTVDGVVRLITIGFDTFTAVWNGGIDTLQVGLVLLADQMRALAEIAPFAGLQRQLNAAAVALDKMGQNAQDLKIGLGGAANHAAKVREQVTQAGSGAEDAVATFRRLQQGVNLFVAERELDKNRPPPAPNNPGNPAGAGQQNNPNPRVLVNQQPANPNAEIFNLLQAPVQGIFELIRRGGNPGVPQVNN